MSRRDCSRADDCVLLRGLLYNRVASSADGAAAMSSPGSGLGTAKLALDRFQVAHARRMVHETETERERAKAGESRARFLFFSLAEERLFFSPLSRSV